MTMTKKLFLMVDKLFYKKQNPPKATAAQLSTITVVRDIMHSEEFADWKLDLLYKPRTDGSAYPVIFEIHGGGFSAGDKAYRDYLSAQYANITGAMVVSANHPLGPEVTFPRPLQCLVSAANWVVDHAEEYHLDTSRMVVTGDSSGAYYAAQLCSMQVNPIMQERYGAMRARFGAAVLNSGLYDLPYALQHPVPFGITTGVCFDISGHKPKELPAWEHMPFVSPSHLVTPDYPKCLVVYAQKDFFCHKQGELFIAALQANGIDFDTFYSTRFLDNHAFSLNSNNKIARQARQRMFDYICDFFDGKL